MPNFTAGTSFTDGVTNDVTAAKLNALVADAVPTSSLALASTTGTISNFTSSTANITLGTIPTLTAGTTTGTAGIFTTGTVTTLNSTTGTITNLSTTLAGDLTISQGTATLSTTGATAATYGTTSDIPRITVDAKGRITAASTVTNPVGFRNRIINGDMRIDQRNAGASVTVGAGSGIYTLDRFSFVTTQASKLTTQQNQGSVTPPIGYKKYLGITSSSTYSVVSGDYFFLTQVIEGYNIADLGWGTNNAQTITLSFWVRSSLTGTFGGSLCNADGSRSYPFSYTILVANTWEQKTTTVVGDASGTWNTENTGGIQIRFGLGSGSSFSGTSGAWTSANYVQPTSTVSVVGTNGATFYITGVQLEAGSTATEFERRPIGTELALCQRYCKALGDGLAGLGISSSSVYFSMPFDILMRATPTATITDTTIQIGNYVSADYTSVGATVIINRSSAYGLVAVLSGWSALGVSIPYQAWGNTNGSFLILASEL